jgi:hypothetical protein
MLGAMFSLVLHATASASRNGRVRGYRNMTIPDSMDSDHTGTSTGPVIRRR